MKFFYTDPLAAAWMSKHFGVKFCCFDGATVSECTILHVLKAPYYVLPDSHAIFTPEEGDVVQDPDDTSGNRSDIFWTVMGDEEFDELDDDDADPYMSMTSATGGHWYKGLVAIVLRASKPFMWPEIEND